MTISKFLTDSYRGLQKLRSKSYSLVKSLFWKTSSILITINPLYLEVQMLPVNSLDLKNPIPTYKPGDIVYVIFSPKQYTGVEWPAIDSPYEIDCKVLEIRAQSSNPRDILYALISGNGAYLEARGAYLVSPKDKHLYGKKEVKRLLEDTELCPSGTIFFESGDYWCNEEYGVFIHNDRMSKILNLFN